MPWPETMQCVVPLAGPQLTHPRYGLLGCHQVDGVPLLKRTLQSRPWWRVGRLGAGDLVFVLREGPEYASLRDAVTDWFQGCRIVTLSRLTKGALLSALAGAAMVTELDEPLIIDLADILYDADVDIEACFAADASADALVPYFEDDDDCYSYFHFAADGSVAYAVEKKVISRHASAGSYIFRSTGHFITATGNALRQFRDELTVGNALFVCPVLNSVIRQGARVLAVPVNNVRSISKLLHYDAA